MRAPTVLIVPGLRDHVAEHWQSLLAEQTPGSRTVPALGRDDLALAPRVEALEREATAIEGPLIIVAHSGGVLIVAHWAMRTQRQVLGALLATPPNLDRPMPEGYPTMTALDEGGWLPVPRTLLPFPSVVAASRDDPLATFEEVTAMAKDWGARLHDIGNAGHLNPASGHGPWPLAKTLIEELAAIGAAWH